MAYDFRAWLKTMPDDKEYTFNDCTGNCAMGQYMTSIGERWSIEDYNRHIRDDLNNSAHALSENHTFGGIKKALEIV